MTVKTRKPKFDEVIELLRKKQFDVTASPGGTLVAKNGAAAVLRQGPDGFVAYVERPGVLVKGEVARLLDRGYQKFIKTSQFELPASASQLHAIHQFTEELTQLSGGISLYNESLGTTSDVYEYDRLKGREEETSAPARPWEQADGH